MIMRSVSDLLAIVILIAVVLAIGLFLYSNVIGLTVSEGQVLRAVVSDVYLGVSESDNLTLLSIRISNVGSVPITRIKVTLCSELIIDSSVDLAPGESYSVMKTLGGSYVVGETYVLVICVYDSSGDGYMFQESVRCQSL